MNCVLCVGRGLGHFCSEHPGWSLPCVSSCLEMLSSTLDLSTKVGLSAMPAISAINDIHDIIFIEDQEILSKVDGKILGL